jgi:hypothetical protein
MLIVPIAVALSAETPVFVTEYSTGRPFGTAAVTNCPLESRAVAFVTVKLITTVCAVVLEVLSCAETDAGERTTAGVGVCTVSFAEFAVDPPAPLHVKV